MRRLRRRGFWRGFRTFLLLGLVAVLAGSVWATVRLWRAGGPSAPQIATQGMRPAPPSPPAPITSGTPLSASAPPRPPASPEDCASPSRAAAAATANAASLTTSPWSAFRKPELGWVVYASLAAREAGTRCGPDRPGFAAALGRWQAAHTLASTGVMDEATLQAMKLVWLARRPFVAATHGGACPPPPPDDRLATVAPGESYGGRAVRLQVRALAAYRALTAAAHAQLPELGADPRLLTVVSGYRGPDEEAARCASEGACGNAGRARCSAHRTGTALDLFLGARPGRDPTSTDDADRAWQAQTPAYRWLVANADRFGFVPYPFEPWHWEYVAAG